MAATQAGKRAIVAEPKTMAAVVGNHICAVAVDYVSVCHYQSHEHQRVVTGYEMFTHFVSFFAQYRRDGGILRFTTLGARTYQIIRD